jgi:hypothetical protein
VTRIGTLVLADLAAWTSPFISGRQVLTFRTRAWPSFAPPTRRMPLGQPSGNPRTNPGRMASPRFRHRLIRFRRFISGSLTLASLGHTCWDLVPAFLQRSLPSLFTTAACSGLGSTSDCRTRGTYPHLSYSSAPPFIVGAFVTHSQTRTFERRFSGIDFRPPNS